MNDENNIADYGTGQKKLGIYVTGTIICLILTIISFWFVMSENFSRLEILLTIYFSAFIQFIVQLVCFIRLNTETEQGQTNVLSLLFTIVILTTILLGSLWIMHHLGYNMVH